MTERRPDLEQSAADEARPLKVIYVMGAGRSGSTALGVLLGNAAGTVFAGELDAWPRRDGVPNGDSAELLAFWEAVRSRIPADAARTGDGLHRRFERPGAVLRCRDATDFRAFNRYLYLAVASAAGVSAVIDTSHYPMRRRNLGELPGVELYTVLLVRDPRAVVDSFGRRDVMQKPKGAVAANLYLWVVHLLSVWVYRSIPPERRMIVRYEDVVANPQDAAASLGEVLSLDFSGVDMTRLRTGLVFQGNRMRVSETVSLVRPETHPPRRPLTAVAQWPWLRRYGYNSAIGRKGRE
jgi:hypothetical protein